MEFIFCIAAGFHRVKPHREEPVEGVEQWEELHPEDSSMMMGMMTSTIELLLFRARLLPILIGKCYEQNYCLNCVLCDCSSTDNVVAVAHLAGRACNSHHLLGVHKVVFFVIGALPQCLLLCIRDI